MPMVVPRFFVSAGTWHAKEARDVSAFWRFGVDTPQNAKTSKRQAQQKQYRDRLEITSGA
jgi:hypothetical protein